MSDNAPDNVSEVDGDVSEEHTTASPAFSADDGHADSNVEVQAVSAVSIPHTDEPRVDAALAALGDVDPSAPSDAVAPLGQVYDRLHRVLTQP